MPMKDEELERIRLRKLREMSREFFSSPPVSSEEKIGESAPTKPIEVTDDALAEVTRKHLVVVVDCWASWCPPCLMLSPIIEELAKDYAGKVLFAKLNVDENQRTALEYEIMSIPTLLVFKNGELVDRFVGAMPRRMLEPKITRHLE